MTSQLQRIGLTPAKAALMAVLALGLVVVWGPALKQMFGGKGGQRASATPVISSAKPTQARGRPTAARNAAPPRRTAQVASEIVPRERQRPTMTVADASAYDPFATPAWSPASKRFARGREATVEPSELETRFDSLRQTGIAMILVSRDGKAAQVGDQTVRVGDTIDGFEVVEITADGVTFKPAPPETEGDARGA